MRKTILDLNNIECKKFFLQQKHYTTIELPKYFEFRKMLLDIDGVIKNSILDQKELQQAKKSENTNYIIFGNKDGQYAWRKLQLINPLLYISLLNVITNKTNWKLIRERMISYRNIDSIKCFSVPVLPDARKSQRATQISEWINEIEKESIRLSLDFDYLYQTDLSNFYGSIYTHSMSWAIHDKSVSKVRRRDYSLCGNVIDEHLKAMSNGQTNGIPEGSVLMDFLAEILLAYMDQKLYEMISSQISDGCYKILRYRDDYRIFVRNPRDGDLIIKALSEVLSGFGFRLNTSKTIQCDEIILNSLKPDKLLYLHNPRIVENSKSNLRTELLLIYEVGRLYPNCGTVKKELDLIYKKYKSTKYFLGQEDELISILSGIAFLNPSAFPTIAAFISKIINYLSTRRKSEIIAKFFRKLNLLPNSGLLEIWLQRITIPNSIDVSYKDKICRKVNDSNVQLFDLSWINSNDCKLIIKKATCINKNKLCSIDKVIGVDEFSIFQEYL